MVSLAVDTIVPKCILWYMYTTFSIKIPKDLKKEAQKTAEEIGVPLSTVINAFLKQFTREKEVTFSTSLKPTPYLEKIIAEVEEDIKHNRNMSGPFSTAEEMIKALNKK